MKAPDKIYLTEWDDKGISEYDTPWSTGYYDEKAHHCKNHEYIRKDALLEWAKEKHDKAFRLHLKKGDKYHYGLGKMHAYKILIDKLNSM